MAVGMVGVSYFCTWIQRLDALIVGWAGVLFFGLCFAVILLRFLRSGPQVMVNEIGIDDRRRKGWGLMRWSDITEIWVGRMYSQKFLCVEVRDADVLVSQRSSLSRKLTKFNQSLGFPAVTISFSGLSPSLQEVLAYIKTHHPDKVRVNGG